MSINPKEAPNPSSAPEGGGGGGSQDDKDAASYIDRLNPKNKSGALKKALKASKKLKKSKGNPKMEDAVGADNLGSMMAEVAQAFSKPTGNDEDFCKHALEQFQALKDHMVTILAIQPQTDDIKEAIAEMTDAMNVLTQAMIEHKCPLPSANGAIPAGLIFNRG